MGAGVSLQIQLVQFYNDFKAGFFSGDADSGVAFNVRVASASGVLVYSNYYEGTGKDPNIQLADGSNAQVALTKAFQQAVASAVDDPVFVRTLLTAGGPAAGAAAAAAAN